MNITLGDPELRPAVLMSFAYLSDWKRIRRRGVNIRNWVLDSGAFSAKKSGVVIDLAEYTDTCTHLLKTDPELAEVFALDVIGDWRASIKNTEFMWKRGVPAIPCFHVNEPPHVLADIAKDYPKIALGGGVGFSAKVAWAEQCFARIWPKRIHGFGFGGEKAMLALPWDSTDATNWQMGPTRFGRYRSLGRFMPGHRGVHRDLRCEVIWHMELERRARKLWTHRLGSLSCDRTRD